MKCIYALVPLSAFLFSSPVVADKSIGNNLSTVKSLINYYFPKQKELKGHKKTDYKLGDFNGDGIEDIAVLFFPVSKPEETSQHKIFMPWRLPGATLSNKYHRSVTIFQGGSDGWFSDEIKVFTFLDTSGVLETPSFELLVIKKNNTQYITHSEVLPVNTLNDILVLPTEAGIDTYIYWDKETYIFLEPEETP